MPIGKRDMIPVTQQLKAITTIDSAALPARDRFQFWNEVICKHFSPAENTPLQEADAFRAKISMRSLGSLGLSRLATSGMVSRRDQNDIRRDTLDCFYIALLTEGAMKVDQNGRSGHQQAGEFCIYDSARPFHNHMDGYYGGYWVKIPRSVMLNRMPNAERLTARPMSSTSPIGRLAANMLREAHGLDLTGDCSSSNRVAMSLIDLLAAAFESEAGLSDFDTSRHGALLDRAKSHILAHLEDTELNSDLLVKELGVSRRTLNRVFAIEDTTPIRWLWQQRLQRAHELLLAGGEYRVSDVALKCGFSDFSHFARAFKSEFGITPRSLLAQTH